MIRINLLPVKEAQRALDRRQQISVALLGLLVAILVMVVPYVLQTHKLKGLEQEVDQLRAEVAQLSRQTAEVRDLDRKRAELEAKLRVIETLKQKRTGPVRILEDLSAATPEKLWLLEFSDVNGQATLTGLALDNQTIAVFMRQLQASKYFFEVDLVETAHSETVRDLAGPQAGSFKKFIIKARLDYLGEGGKPAPSPTAASAPARKTGT